MEKYYYQNNYAGAIFNSIFCLCCLSYYLYEEDKHFIFILFGIYLFFASLLFWINRRRKFINLTDDELIIFYGTWNAHKNIKINLSDIVECYETNIDKASFSTVGGTAQVLALKIKLNNEIRFQNKNDEQYFSKAVPVIYTFQVSQDLKTLYLLLLSPKLSKQVETDLKEKIRSIQVCNAP